MTNVGSSTCAVLGCGKRHEARGWCSAHYQRWRAHGDPLGGATPRGALLTFLNEVVLAYDGDECLTWPYGRDKAGYGQISIDGKKANTHRIVCEKAHGPPPTPEHEAAHSCGKGHLGCVAKRHLSWKTHVENEADKLAHGTRHCGERHHMTKLTENNVREMRALRGVSQREIARQFGVSAMTANRILRRESWTHLEERGLRLSQDQ